eukprot:m.106116 g.106116  ORF g.106116 m.106116 type:complete len:127 (+) comp51673_c0_seq13:288-668(+)
MLVHRSEIIERFLIDFTNCTHNPTKQDFVLSIDAKQSPSTVNDFGVLGRESSKDRLPKPVLCENGEWKGMGSHMIKQTRDLCSESGMTSLAVSLLVEADDKLSESVVANGSIRRRFPCVPICSAFC